MQSQSKILSFFYIIQWNGMSLSYCHGGACSVMGMDFVLNTKSSWNYQMSHFSLQLLKKEENSSNQQVLRASQQLVDCLVENVLRLEEKSAGMYARLKCISSACNMVWFLVIAKALSDRFFTSWACLGS